MPGFENANPSSAMSWAGFLADYGSWLAGLPGGEISRIPIFNAAYRRSALLELGPRLDVLLSTGDELLHALRAAGGRFVFEPSARIAHLNIAGRRDWIVERYLGGLVTAHSRMERWPRRRRLLYAAASPLIPAVLLARLLPGLENGASDGSRSGERLPGGACRARRLRRRRARCLPRRLRRGGLEADGRVRAPQGSVTRAGDVDRDSGSASLGLGGIACTHHLPALRRIRGVAVVAFSNRIRGRETVPRGWHPAQVSTTPPSRCSPAPTSMRC